MGRFSTDRTIKEYADEIWGLKSVKVEAPDRLRDQRRIR